MAAEKVALVTAGGSGMGAGAARRLAADGFRVGILSSSGKGEALAAELGGFGVTGSNTQAVEILMMTPDFCFCICGVTRRVGRITFIR